VKNGKENHSMTRFGMAASLLAGGLVFAAGCSSKPAAQSVAPVTAPTPTIVRAEPAPEPPPAARPAVAEDTLPSSVDEINKRGYLKDVFFDLDKAEIRTDQRDKLAADGTWLRSHPSVKVRIEGHCDERGTEAYNLALGEHRAAAVRAYLTTLGVDEARIATISYGKDRPFATGHDEAAWAENRRDHFLATAR
jgi:peptidoglycan-associated lipoprotein